MTLHRPKNVYIAVKAYQDLKREEHKKIAHLIFAYISRAFFPTIILVFAYFFLIMYRNNKWYLQAMTTRGRARPAEHYCDMLTLQPTKQNQTALKQNWWE